MKLMWSKFNICFKVDGKTYIYNMLSTSIAEIDQQIELALNTNDSSGLESEFISALKEEGFLVDTIENETDKYFYFYDLSRYSRAADCLSIVFIPTYYCNLRCTYCYEGKKDKLKRISKEETDAIIRFAEKRILDSNSNTPVKELSVLLYGGEPLLCKKELLYFCEEITKLASRYSIDLSIDMVSNLTLLDEETIDFISKYDIHVQVSIDGDKEEHDIRRIRADGSGTFDVIIANLERLIEKGLKSNITIRLNTDVSNKESVIFLYKKAMKYSNDVYLGYLTKYGSLNDSFTSKCIETNCDDSKAIVLPSSFYKRLNLPIPQHFGKKGPCSLNCENKYLVDCFLDVYKCDLLIGHKECRVGYIDYEGNFIKNGQYYSQMCFSPAKSEKCINCKLLPMCGGGCPAKEYLKQDRKDGNINIFDCDITERTLEEFLTDYVEGVEG